MCFVPNKPSLEDIVVGIESGIKGIDYQNQDLAGKECMDLMKTKMNPKNNFKSKGRSLKIISDLKKKDLCFYLKSDIGNAIVVLKKTTLYRQNKKSFK